MNKSALAQRGRGERGRVDERVRLGLSVLLLLLLLGLGSGGESVGDGSLVGLSMQKSNESKHSARERKAPRKAKQ
jgi:hypothetical protein